MSAVRRALSGAAAICAAVLVLGATSPLSAYVRPGHTERVSTPPGGRDPGAPSPFAPNSLFPSISSDGRFVAFQSSADDLVRDDVNKMTDIFVHDRKTGRIEIVSVRSDGTRSVGIPVPGGFIPGAGIASISGNGRFVAFSSAAVNLVDLDSNADTDIFVHDRGTGRTERVSISSTGRQANAASSSPSVSLDGRFVAFESMADNLVSGDTNQDSDIFIHDRRTGRTERVSVSSGEAQATDASHCASLGSGGRYVAFTSYATNLAPTPGAVQVYVRDRKRGITELISVPLDGPEPAPTLQQGSEACPLGGRSISAKGRYVVFESYMPDLVPNDANGITPQISNEDVFLRDRRARETRRISVTSAGEEVDALSSGGTISPDGHHVVFASYAGNLSPDQPPATSPGPLGADDDVFIHDVRSGITHWISRGVGGAAARSDTGFTMSRFTAVAADGRFVTFHSNADNLVRATNVSSAFGEIFVRTRGGEQGVAELLASSGAQRGAGPTVSGRTAGDVEPIEVAQVPRPPAGAELRLRGAEVLHRPTQPDLFVRLRIEDAPPGAALAAAVAGNVYGLSFSVNGRAYEVRAAMTPEGLPTARFGLFSCDELPVCDERATLRGGFATTGREIVVAIPRDLLGVRGRPNLFDLSAFSGVGSYRTGLLP